MATEWKVEQREETFLLRVKCGPIGETGREEWTGTIVAGRDGRTRVDGMTGAAVPGTGGTHYFKNDLEPALPEALPGMLEEIAARCARATREMELWEAGREQREAEAGRNAGRSRQVLAELASAGYRGT